eukprot:TRINITY_DN12250_c0_g4_i2.p1 TRINITY_DN12250_c0_g4~~TRINITY_DN12250_c0_g4_i2.p1  ORF type:complete len:300 (+),score=23.27 TRINITY_DN12250_c0_g4_i2:477-1376(+)
MHANDVIDDSNTRGLRAASATTQALRPTDNMMSETGSRSQNLPWEPMSGSELPPLCPGSELQSILLQTQQQLPLPLPGAPRPQVSIEAVLAREQFRNAPEQTWQNVIDAVGTCASSPLDVTLAASLRTTCNAQSHVHSSISSASVSADSGLTQSSLSTTPGLFHRSLTPNPPRQHAIQASGPFIPGSLPVVPHAFAMTNSPFLPFGHEHVVPTGRAGGYPIPPPSFPHFWAPCQALPQLQPPSAAINPLTQPYLATGMGPFTVTSLPVTATFPDPTTTASLAAPKGPLKPTQLHPDTGS